MAEQLGPPLEQATDAHQPGFDQGSQPLGRQDERVISPGFRGWLGDRHCGLPGWHLRPLRVVQERHLHPAAEGDQERWVHRSPRRERSPQKEGRALCIRQLGVYVHLLLVPAASYTPLPEESRTKASFTETR